MKFETEIHSFQQNLFRYDKAISRINGMIKAPGGRTWPSKLHLAKTSGIDDFEKVGGITKRLKEKTLPKLEEDREKVSGQIAVVIDSRLEEIHQFVSEGCLPDWTSQALDREKLIARYTKKTSDVSESDEPNTTRRFELPNKKVIEVRDGVNAAVLRTLMPTSGGVALASDELFSTVCTELNMPRSKVTRNRVHMAVSEIDGRLKPFGYEIMRRRDFSKPNPKEVDYLIVEYDPRQVFRSVDDLKVELGNDPRIAKLVDDNHIFRNLRTILRERPDLWPTRLVQNGFKWDETSFKRLVTFFREELKMPDKKDDSKPNSGERISEGKINNSPVVMAGNVGKEERQGTAGERRSAPARPVEKNIDPWGSSKDDLNDRRLASVPSGDGRGVNSHSPQNLEKLVENKKKEIMADLTLRLLSKIMPGAEKMKEFCATKFITDVCDKKITLEELIGVIIQEDGKKVLRESPEAFLTRVVLTETFESLQAENPGVKEKRIRDFFRSFQSKWSLPRIADHLCNAFGLSSEEYRKYIGGTEESSSDSSVIAPNVEVVLFGNPNT